LRFEFEKEAQLLANLRHSNVLTLLGISGDPIELMAMEMKRVQKKMKNKRQIYSF